MDLVAISNAEGTIIYISPSVTRLLGYSVEEVIGARADILIEPSDLERVSAAFFDQFDDGEPNLVEFQARHRDGSPRDFEAITINLLHEPDIRGFVTHARDITERVAAERMARQLTEVLERTSELVVLSDLTGHLVHANRRAREFFGLDHTRHVSEFANAASREQLRTEIMPFVRQHGIWTGELTLRSPSGEEMATMSTIQAHRERGQISLVSTTAHDITELKRTNTQLEHEATHDALTGLPNRVLFNELGTQAIARAAREGSMIAVLFLDLDRFKEVNDSLGHEAGDRLLVEVARRLQSGVRTGDTVARISGDEFCVLCEHVRGCEEARDIAERLLDALGQPLSMHGHDFDVGASIGMALDEQRDKTIGDLLRDADVALYQAKRSGGRRAETFDPSLPASRLVD